jgi:hypothetical protein
MPLLDAPPEQGPVCPACGTEFEIDDRYRSHDELRQQWMRAGAHWFSSVVRPPAQWEKVREQLLATYHPFVSDTAKAETVDLQGWETVLPLGLSIG